jgi:S-sulfo-L-cysteine synthase (O-acetyl-L-serine-dependent)
MSTAAPGAPGMDLLDRVGNTPLLRLNRITRWLPERVQIYAKAEFMNPGGSVKDRPAKNMILEALKSGKLTKDKVLLDSTSGNTGIAYAMFGAALGIQVELVMPENASAKKDIIEAFGARLRFTDPMEGSDGALLEAQRLREENPDKYFLPDQYNNDDNWRAHYKTTAEEVWSQTGGKVTHLVAGIGTGGTLTGTGRRLKELNPRVSVVAVEPATPLHGLEGLKHMASSIVPGIYDEKVHDRKVSVFTEDAYEMTCRLAREEGMLVGYSAGAALQGAFEVAMGLKEGVIVTVFPDAGERYLQTRFWADLITLFEKEGK